VHIKYKDWPLNQHFIAYNNPKSPSCRLAVAGLPVGKLFLVFLFCFLILYSFLAKMKCRELKKNFYKYLGHPRSTIIREHGTCLCDLSVPPACVVPDVSKTVIQ
jgi:hypothetical protein